MSNNDIDINSYLKSLRFYFTTDVYNKKKILKNLSKMNVNNKMILSTDYGFLTPNTLEQWKSLDNKIYNYGNTKNVYVTFILPFNIFFIAIHINVF